MNILFVATALLPNMAIRNNFIGFGNLFLPDLAIYNIPIA
jgi:hypothetical protein